MLNKRVCVPDCVLSGCVCPNEQQWTPTKALNDKRMKLKKFKGVSSVDGWERREGVRCAIYTSKTG